MGKKWILCNPVIREELRKMQTKKAAHPVGGHSPFYNETLLIAKDIELKKAIGRIEEIKATSKIPS